MRAWNGRTGRCSAGRTTSACAGQLRLRGARRAGDEAAPVAVPEAQGKVGEVRALPGRAPVAGHGPHAPEGADGQLGVGEGISNESRVREIRTLGSMSGERKRSQGGE